VVAANLVRDNGVAHVNGAPRAEEQAKPNLSKRRRGTWRDIIEPSSDNEGTASTVDTESPPP
jgi:hypothetical protein